MFDRGYYGYKKEGVEIETVYRIEWTDDQKIVDLMDTVEFDYSMLKKTEFKYLEDAITFWNSLYYSKSVLHLMLFEQIVLNGEVVLEQEKDATTYVPIHSIVRQYYEEMCEAQKERELVLEENKKLKEFLEKYHVDIKEVLKK